MYMHEWITVLGLVLTAALVLIPVVMVGRVVLAIVRDVRREREAKARKVVHAVPRLGELSSTDGRLWFGEVQGLQVSVISTGRPPDEAQTAQVRAIIAKLPRIVEQGKAYLLVHEDCSWLDGGPDRFGPLGIHVEDGADFVLELVHPADVDGVYRVEFREGEPVGSVRDD
jgi:hypothetical protein